MDTIRRALIRWIRYIPKVSVVNYVVKIPLSKLVGKRDFVIEGWKIDLSGGTVACFWAAINKEKQNENNT